MQKKNKKMSPKEFKYYLQRAFDEGMNDDTLQEALDENARLFISNEVTENLSDEQHAELLTAYQNGFIRGFGVSVLEEIISNSKK